MNKNLFILLSVITLVACGGGGGGSGAESAPDPTPAAPPLSNNTATPSTNPTAPPAVEDPAPENITSTKDLSVSETFDFTSSYDVAVNINLGAGTNRYLNICNDFQRTSGQTNVDYDSCVLQAPLDDGQYQGTLSLTNDSTELVVAIWTYSGGEPEYYFWELENDGPLIEIN